MNSGKPTFETIYNEPFYDHNHDGADCQKEVEARKMPQSWIAGEGEGYMGQKTPWDIALL